MRKDGVLATTLAVTVLAAGAAGAAWSHGSPIHLTGPPPGHTGGFGEPTCLECHTGSPLNAFGGSIRIEGLPDVLEAGGAYLLAVTLRADETSAAGFQLAARFSEGEAAGQPAGSLRPVDDRVAVTVDSLGRTYAHHTEAGVAVVESGGSSWIVEWLAPGRAAPVVFHVSGNSANGDNSPLGDLIFAGSARVGAGPTARP